MPLRVFICYAREEAKFLRELLTATADLARNGVEFFYDEGVPWGEKWQETLFARIDAAHMWLAVALKPESGGTRSAGASVVHEVDRQELQVSKGPLSCDKDTFDVDTKAPGHGGMPQVNARNHGGRRAELILDPERLHTPSDDPLLLPLNGEEPAMIARMGSSRSYASVSLPIR